MDLQALLNFAIENGASDIHLQASAPPMLRIGGKVQAVKGDPLTNEQLQPFVTSIAPACGEGGIVAAAANGLDFSTTVPPNVRMRCSAYCAMGQIGMVMRIIRTKIPTIDDLNLPAVIHDVAMSGRGMTLLVGTTGSGKSTTLAAMIDMINSIERAKIITVSLVVVEWRK
jgi:Tfp pilus assembly pilus retraction ATPase PilT